MKTFIFACFSILFLAIPAAAQQGWVKLNSGTTAGFNFISLVGPDTVYVSGEQILRSTDAGATWEQNPGLPMQSGRLQFVDDSFGFLSGGNTFYRTTNGGLTWDSSTFHGSWAIFGSRYRGMGGGFTSDGGITWHSPSGSDLGDINCLAYADSLHAFAMGRAFPWPDSAPPFTTAAVWHATPDGGQTWIGGYAHPSIDGKHSGIPRDVYGIAALNSDTVFSVGLQLGRTTDGGIDWDTITYPGDNGFETYESISFADNHNGWTVSYGAKILHTTDGGNTWFMQSSGVTLPLLAVKALDSLVAYAVGVSGTIIKTTNAGQSWVNISPISSNLIPGTVYPQPAATNTSIAYNLPQPQRVSLSIQNVTGATVQDVLDKSPQSDGIQTVKVNTSDLASGTYTYVLQTEKYYATGKIEVIH